MWSDNESALDFLGFHHLADGIQALVEDDSLLPITIGVFGDWGSGKSTLLYMVREKLKRDEATIVLSFNGWLFEGYEDAKTALMSSILDAVTSNRKLSRKAFDLAGKLLGRVKWMRLAGAGLKYGIALAAGGPAAVGVTAGLDAISQAREAVEKLGKDYKQEEAAKFLNDDPGQDAIRGVRDFRDDFGKLLKETNIKRLVVMVDDLDRCNPATIIETLEAIKLFLFVPHTAFILGADERLIRYAVRKRFPELEQSGEKAEVGIHYLEKLVQFPIRIPQLGHAEIETYINLLFASICESLLPGQFESAMGAAVPAAAGSLHGVNFNHGVAQQLFGEVPQDLAENLALAQRLAPVLTPGLFGNPRQCKRFLNTLLVRGRMAKSRGIDLSQTVLAKLMLVEYFRPEWFKRLADLQAAQNGRPDELAAVECRARAKPVGEVAAHEDEKVADAPAPKGGTQAKAAAPKTPPSEPETDVSPEFQTWILDPWMNEWLASEPALATIDLRPYFFFSRDTLGPLGASVRRLSPAAQAALSQMLEESDAQRAVAVKKAGSLSPSDAAAVFESLLGQMKREDDLGADKSLLWRVFKWADARSELRGQLVMALSRLPEKLIPVGVVPLLAQITKGNETEAHAKQLLAKWEQSTTNRPLSAAAKAIKRRV